MRIALVVHDFHRAGGHSRYVYALAEAFAPAHEVHVFAHTFQGALPEGVQSHRVFCIRQSAFTTIMSFPWFVGGQLREGFDIVHAQGYSAPGADVVSAHICQDGWRAARVASDGMGARERLGSAAISRMERRIYGRAPVVIAVSEKIRQELARYYGRVERVEVIHHGVDLEEFRPEHCRAIRERVRREFGLADQDLTALYVGDLQKAWGTLARLIAGVDELRLLCVSRSSASALKAAARRFHAEHRLIIRPGTDRIVDAYAAADLFVFPTVYDAFGMVVSEAMACGLPVIMSRAAGVAELIQDASEAVVLDSPLNVGEWVSSVKALLSNPARRNQLGLAARRRMENHSWARAARNTLSLYERLMAERSGRRVG